ncbi:MAG: hypothetical protein KC731_21195 [Myxococcales bacterium]|nr:hypothetical protein [Myxococcales bacterium]
MELALATTPIVAGVQHSCVLLRDGHVRCWGGNSFAQLGDGTTDDRFAPVEVAGIDDAILVAAGELATCAQRRDRSVWCWGTIGSSADRVFEPTSMPGLSDVASLAIGNGFVCGLQRDGQVACRGEGIGAPEGSAQLVPGMARIAELVAGAGHVCGRDAEGGVRCWGRNGHGELGSGDTRESFQATRVGGVEGVVALWAGPSTTYARTEAGEVLAWGYDPTGRERGAARRPWRIEHPPFEEGERSVGLCLLSRRGQVRCQSFDERSGPHAAVAFPGPVVELAVGSGHACGLGEDDVIRCFGDNDHGQLGVGNAAGAVGRPTRVAGVEAVEIVVGEWNACARDRRGRVTCWDKPWQPMTEPPPTPELVPGLSGVTALHTGGQYTCAVAGGVTRCWGKATFRPCRWLSRDNCQSEDWEEPQRVPGLADLPGAVEVLGDCARPAVGPVTCRADDRLASPETVAQSADAVQLAGAARLRCLRRRSGVIACRWPGSEELLDLESVRDAIDLHASSSHFCAVRATGEVVCSRITSPQERCDSPSDPCGEVATVPGIRDAVQVVTGNELACARHRDGGVSCWGKGAQGVLGDGTTRDHPSPVRLELNQVAELGAREHHVCARTEDGAVWCWGDLMAGLVRSSAAAPPVMRLEPAP